VQVLSPELAEGQSLLALRGIVKRFGRVGALNDVDFEASAGEVVALVGDNGAGKSTLVKIVSGSLHADEGTILFGGRPVSIPNPRAAAALGIQTVYQDLALCDNLPVVDNLYLGRERRITLVPHIARFLAPNKMEAEAAKTFAALGVRVPSLDRPIATLSGGQRQAVAVARAVLWGSTVVLLDEPTAALGVEQTAHVLELVRRLRERGLAVVLVSPQPCGRLRGRRPDRRAPARQERWELRSRPRRARAGRRGDHRRRRTRGRVGVIGVTERRRAALQLVSPGAVVARTLARVRDGELGPIPVFAALLLIGVFFQLQNDNFLSARNLSNLVLQIGVLAPLAFGVVLVLLVGEIDLSIAALTGFCAGVLAVLLADHGWNPYLTMLAVTMLGAGIGAVHGLCVVSLGIPSFVVTLGGLLVWQGALLALLSDQGEKLVQSTAVTRIASSYLTHAHAWIALTVGLAAYAAWLALSREFRRRAGLPIPAITAGLVRLGLAGAASSGIVVLLDGYFGVPWVLVILLIVMWLLTLITRRTAFGRHIYAVGGDREAARRAGISVAAVKVTVFALAGALAGIAGILAASRAFSVSNATGGGNLLLDAIAAAVIGGTSLFGGRGHVYQGLLGALVIGSVANGFDLLGQSTATKSIATGIILVVAVGVDALSRRRRLATGTAGA